MSYARFTKANYDRSLTFAENAKRISAMWHSQKAKKGGGFGFKGEPVYMAGGDQMKKNEERILRMYPIGQGKKKGKKGCKC